MYTAAKFLVVEDNLKDIQRVQACFKDPRIANCLSVVTNGDEALRFLKRQGEYNQAPIPDIILISLPILRDHEDNLLQQIKALATLQPIPTVVLMAHRGEEAILRPDPLVSLCVSKPLNLECLFDLVKHLTDFGLIIATQQVSA